MISRNGPKKQGSRRPGATWELTLQEHLWTSKDHSGPRIPRGMQQMCNPHKPMRQCSPIRSRTTPWRWQISQRQQNPTEHWLRCWWIQSRIYQPNSLLSPQIWKRHNPRTPVKKSVHRSAQDKHGHHMTNHQIPSNRNSLRDCNVYSRNGHKFDPSGYCLFNGFRVKEYHTFATCRFLGDGHKKMATRLDNKGEKKRNKGWFNDEPTKWGGFGLDNDIVDMNEKLLIILIIILNLYIQWRISGGRHKYDRILSDPWLSMQQ